jgi:hypothetical protein
VLARVRLELSSDVGWTVLRVGLDEQVYVVVCYLQRQNFVPEVVSSLTKQLSYIFFNHVENRVAVLRTPHEVILAGTNRMCMTAVLLHP